MELSSVYVMQSKFYPKDPSFSIQAVKYVYSKAWSKFIDHDNGTHKGMDLKKTRMNEYNDNVWIRLMERDPQNKAIKKVSGFSFSDVNEVLIETMIPSEVTKRYSLSQEKPKCFIAFFLKNKA